jgi:RNA 3'-terminal phosphate cyclase (ATP)
MIAIDGSAGEGGGQILRTALALSLVTGEAFRIEKIRAGRKKPGLLRQHLTAVQAAVEIGNAKVQGAELGSIELAFKPGKVQPGDYRFAVGTAGSAMLVLQTILPALLVGSQPSTLRLEGGTHNPQAPPFDFVEKAFLPLLNRMGPVVTAHLDCPGFYPAGGGKFSVTIQPVEKLSKLELLQRGEIKRRVARGIVANLPRNIAARELAVVAQQLNWPSELLQVDEIKNSCGPGNALVIELESDSVTEVFTGFGERGVSAETVASSVAQEVRDYLACDAPVGVHLADQLLLPLAMVGSGCFRTSAPSRHTTTNIETIKQFLQSDLRINRLENTWQVACGSGKIGGG